jgi:uncharacterized Zn finger protein
MERTIEVDCPRCEVRGIKNKIVLEQSQISGQYLGACPECSFVIANVIAKDPSEIAENK